MPSRKQHFALSLLNTLFFLICNPLQFDDLSFNLLFDTTPVVAVAGASKGCGVSTSGHLAVWRENKKSMHRIAHTPCVCSAKKIIMMVHSAPLAAKHLGVCFFNSSQWKEFSRLSATATIRALF